MENLALTSHKNHPICSSFLGISHHFGSADYKHSRELRLPCLFSQQHGPVLLAFSELTYKSDTLSDCARLITLCFVLVCTAASISQEVSTERKACF